MTDLFDKLIHWWAGGDLLMPVMLAVSVVLYAIIGERVWALYGPRSRRRRRADELSRLMRAHNNANDRDWVGTYIAIAEEAELSRGLLIVRVLTVCLPLFGLLGTVTGMIDTFGALAAPGAQGQTAQQASAGIGLALTATQYGMALAIPAVLAEWVLRRRIDDIVHQRETISAQVSTERHLKAT